MQVITRLFNTLPADISATLSNFVIELQARPSAGLLSASLLVSIYSASNGFRAIIRGVNRAQDYKDERNFIKKTALCAALMLIFTFSIVVMLTLWIFSDALLSALAPLLPINLNLVIRLSSAAIALAVLVGSTTWIYYLACANPKKGRLIPGACVTVLCWAIASEVFAIFMGRFSNISVIYGSIAGIFILIIWLNLISFFLLLGNSVNALINTFNPPSYDKPTEHHPHHQADQEVLSSF
jgi:membrane protein